MNWAGGTFSILCSVSIFPLDSGLRVSLKAVERWTPPSAFSSSGGSACRRKFSVFFAFFSAAVSASYAHEPPSHPAIHAWIMRDRQRERERERERGREREGEREGEGERRIQSAKRLLFIQYLKLNFLRHSSE